MNFHPKTDAETKLESRTHNAKVCEAVASRYCKMLRKWTGQTGEIGTKPFKRSESRGEWLGNQLHRIANTCTLFLRGIKERLFSLTREPLHTISEPQVRT
ncbi:hypothetical protein [Prevotella disiens]|uniref:hypothetical protein n=1 Tax=Prevotella disiens TaxID=28130 RepID=UPI00131F4622|nr:hypothetical protein [Prevotella disiens]